MTSLLLDAADRLCARIRRLSKRLGREIRPDAATCLDRSDVLRLSPPDRLSANGSCRLLQASDGWVALNLPRPSDWELVPALLEMPRMSTDWDEISEYVAAADRTGLLERAALLGLALASVGEVRAHDPIPALPSFRRPATKRRLTGLDLSTLWAGPLCAGLLADFGVSMVRIENSARPDPATLLPAFDQRLNASKHRLHVDLSAPGTRQEILAAIANCDILVTNARPRALEQFGWSEAELRRENPGLIHVAITGYGSDGDAGRRTGFGDDAAAAGGLVGSAPDGSPCFLGDALADPLTGLAACASALEALLAERAGRIDAALARTAAGIHSWMGQAALT